MHLVEVGFACNNACVFCAQGSLREGGSAPAFDALQRSVESLPAGEAIAFVGGEPTLLGGLVELVRLARSRGARAVLVQTNARLLAAAGAADALAEAGVTGLDVSLHGSSEPMHDYHTGIDGSFRQTVAGIRRARAASLAVATTTVVTRSNARHLSEIVRVAHVLGARGVRLLAAQPLGRAAIGAPSIVPPASARVLVRHAAELARRLDLAFSDSPTASELFAPLATVEVRPVARPFSVHDDSGALPQARAFDASRASAAMAPAFEG